MAKRNSKGFTPPPTFTNVRSGFLDIFSRKGFGNQIDFRKKLVGGFTAIEILIVMAILVVLMATIVPSFLAFRQKGILNTETQELVTTINRARLLSVSSKNDQQFGVHFETGKIVLFQGTVYDVASTTTNEVHLFDPAITATTTINGGGSEVVFQKVTGATIQNATTTLSVIGTTASSTVLIRLSGIGTIY